MLERSVELRTILFDRCWHPPTIENIAFAERALANGLPIIEESLPTVADLIQTKRESKCYNIEEVLYASCLAIFRREKTLSGISKDTLFFLKATRSNYENYDNKDEEDRFDEELNLQLFRDQSDVEAFARVYLEPLLKECNEDSFEVGYFLDKAEFASLLETMAFEWLEAYPLMPKQVLSKLFLLCASLSDRDRLNALIRNRCEELRLPECDFSEDRIRHRKAFWFLRYFFFISDDFDFVVSWLSSSRDLIFEIYDLTDRHFGNADRCFPELSSWKVYLLLSCFVEKWPRVTLSDSWGSHSPPEERAYRFLNELMWRVGKDSPEEGLEAIESILSDERFSDFRSAALTLRARAFREIALRDFKAPSPAAVAASFDNNQIATVEELRALLLQVLDDFQTEIHGSEFDPVEVFYQNGVHVDEPTACKRTAHFLSERLKALNLKVVIEHQLKDAKRCDITAERVFEGRRRLLVVEAKGQWHIDLYSASKAQLYERYAIHQDAEHQGIYLVFWFGAGVPVAGSRSHSIKSAEQLKQAVINEMPQELSNSVDVFVLDVSRRN